MENSIQYKRAEYFFKNKIKVHAVLIYGYFINGTILELKPKYMVIQDLSLTQKTIFFAELKLPLERYREREE